MRDNIQKIEADYENKIIRCGDLFEIKSFVPMLDWIYVVNRCGVGQLSSAPRFKNGKKYKPCGVKERNKKASEKLGIPPKKYAKMLKGIQYKMWLKENHELMAKLCMSNFKSKWIFDKRKVENFHNNIETIKQYEKDGLYNLIPFAFNLGKSTKELKEQFGKSTWKSLCKNSFTRNLLISNDCINFSNIRKNHAIKRLNRLSTTSLKYNDVLLNYKNSDSYIWFDNFLKKERALTTDKYTKSQKNRMMHIAEDTLRMSERINRNFNVNWSLKKLEQKHKEYTHIVEQERFPDIFIDSLKDIKIKEYKSERFIATLIDTPFKLKKQGNEQNHCVASYVNLIEDGEYLVYDIKENDKTVSTLGIRYGEIYNVLEVIDIESNTTINSNTLKDMDDKKIKIEYKYEFSQHYGKNNKIIEDEELKEFAEEIVKKLNESVDKNKNT